MDVIEQVREGTDVVDASGDKVGEVRLVRMGDADAVTAEGQQTQPSLFERIITDLFADTPDMNHEQAERLVRVGYVQIDRPLFESDAYVPSDRLARVDGNTLHLAVSLD